LVFLGTQSELQQELAASEGSLEQLFLQLTAEGNGRPSRATENRRACVDRNG